MELLPRVLEKLAGGDVALNKDGLAGVANSWRRLEAGEPAILMLAFHRAG